MCCRNYFVSGLLKKKKSIVFFNLLYPEGEFDVTAKFQSEVGITAFFPSIQIPLDSDIVFHLPLRNPDLSCGPPSRLTHSQHPPGLAVLMEPMTGTTFFPLSFPDPELGSLPVFCFAMLMIKEKKKGLYISISSSLPFLFLGSSFSSCGAREYPWGSGF